MDTPVSHMLFHIRSLLLLFFASACFPFAEIIDLSASLHRKTRLFSANICPQRRNKLTLILSDFHKNASVFCCIMRKSFAALLFYHSVQTRIIHFELWNIFYIMKNMLSSCATEKESPQFSPVELSSPGNLHFPILCPVHAMVPLSPLHSYTGTGFQSPLCQMLT